MNVECRFFGELQNNNWAFVVSLAASFGNSVEHIQNVQECDATGDDRELVLGT